jgi:amino-acid N-acetyltransferase
MDTSETITIEPARAEDLSAILSLLERSGLPKNGLSDHVATALVGRLGRKVVGSAALELYGTAALLRSLVVESGLRGQGLGQRLMRAALAQARRLGVSQVYLLTETASGFFPRFGFRPISRAEVTPEVQCSVQFTSACPVSAQAMLAELRLDSEGL